jgi:hypothetical protein
MINQLFRLSDLLALIPDEYRKRNAEKAQWIADHYSVEKFDSVVVHFFNGEPSVVDGMTRLLALEIIRKNEQDKGNLVCKVE